MRIALEGSARERIHTGVAHAGRRSRFLAGVRVFFIFFFFFFFSFTIILVAAVLLFADTFSSATGLHAVFLVYLIIFFSSRFLNDYFNFFFVRSFVSLFIPNSRLAAD